MLFLSCLQSCFQYCDGTVTSKVDFRCVTSCSDNTSNKNQCQGGLDLASVAGYKELHGNITYYTYLPYVQHKEVTKMYDSIDSVGSGRGEDL